MAAKLKQFPLLFVCHLLFISAIPQCSCQTDLPRNIETSYPFPPIVRPPNPAPPPTSQSQISPSAPSQHSSNPSSKNTVIKAVAATVASTLVISALFFFLLQRYKRTRKRAKDINSNINHINPDLPHNDEFIRFDGNIKGLIVDENGLDVLYWKKLEGENINSNFDKAVLDGKEVKNEKEEKVKRTVSKGKKQEPVQQVPLLRGKSSTSHSPVWTEHPPLATKAIPKAQTPPAPPPPPPIQGNNSPAPPPLPPTTVGGSTSHMKPPPPPPPKGTPTDGKQGENKLVEAVTRNGSNQVKLKPLHWDKVNPNVDHSMVWDKVNGGSFRFDGDLMEALFGSVAINRKSPRRDSHSSSPDYERSGPPSQIFILETRKSQNTAIVLRSLGLSRNEIVDALIDGQGLNAETLEKLTKIAPKKEEESDILAFDGDPTRLANAESFLYHLLKAVPSAFTRFNAMLFRSNYNSEVLHFKESLQILELGSKELRARGLFLKLLEAVLKAGNRMNAGTSRGSAQAFKLTALLKLSDVKSTDGKTTLLRFVVEEVVRAEGKRYVLNRNRSSSHRTNGQSSGNISGNLNVGNSNMTDDALEKDYMMHGLPLVGGLSSEFCNAKKAATIDYDIFSKTYSHISTCTAEIRQLVARCASATHGEEEGFIKEMKGFLKAAEEEINALRDEQTRVMELVKKTTEYYQSGASIDKGTQPLQLFIIVRDFLGMVDQVCVDIARNMQRNIPAGTARAESVSSSNSPATRISVRFPKLPQNFLSENLTTTANSSKSSNVNIRSREI